MSLDLVKTKKIGQKKYRESGEKPSQSAEY